VYFVHWEFVLDEYCDMWHILFSVVWTKMRISSKLFHISSSFLESLVMANHLLSSNQIVIIILHVLLKFSLVHHVWPPCIVCMKHYNGRVYVHTTRCYQLLVYSKYYTVSRKKEDTIVYPLLCYMLTDFPNFLMADSVVNLQQHDHERSHHTLNELLHYLVKYLCWVVTVVMDWVKQPLVIIAETHPVVLQSFDSLTKKIFSPKNLQNDQMSSQECCSVICWWY